MKNLFKWLLFSSVPGIILTLILSVNWQTMYSDVRNETTARAESYYEQTRPDFFDDIEKKFSEFSTSGGAEKENLPQPCRRYEAHVSEITDGDTIIVTDAKKVRHKIRFRGIDAPERTQDFGIAAKENLLSLIYQKKVAVETCEKDRYYPEREIALIKLGEISVAQMQIKSGFAHYYKDFAAGLPPNEKLSLAEAETEAKRAKRGLWENPNPVLPKDFRRITSERYE